jgi:hypothetical protein
MELIRGVLPTEGIAGVYGASASGKSFFVYDAAAAIANGDPEWFGHVITKSVPVTIVSLEGAMNNRAAALQLKRGDCPNLKIVRTSLDIRLEADRAALVKDIRRIGFAGGVLVIDTLSRSAGGIDENGPREMGEYIAHIESMRVALGGLVVLIHHSGKDAAKGMRGHTSLFAALDTVIEVTATDGRREWKLIKSKEGEAGIVHPFNLEIHHLGDNPDGTPITSCTVQEDHSEAVDQTFTQKKKPLGANQKTLWRELGVLLRASVHFGMAGAPPTRPCLRLSEVVDAVQGTLVVTDEKRRIERTKAALDGLLDKDLIRHRDGWIWEV